MNPWLLIACVLAALVLAEVAARIFHRLKYLTPFHSKVIGEYPFSQFLEKTGPPLYFRFKKNFHSPMVNINRLRCRGPEPAPDGTKKRLLVMGESYLFGVKLRKEEQLWSSILQRLLDESMPGQWEVLNASNPGYNANQHLELWRQELKKTKPDIVIAAMGGNDIAIASLMGPKWQPGAPWPLDFIMALERKSPLWNKFLSRFCLYFLWRRLKKGPPKSNFAASEQGIPREACHENIKQNYRALVREARDMGAKVACTFYAPAVDFDLDPRDQRRAASIQANWKETLETRTSFDLKLMKVIKEELCPELELSFIDFFSVFRSHPKRFEMYFDLAHWNQRGMPLVAQTIMNEIDKLGWWRPPQG
jgi:lysophospholipase L1-like esterase